MAEPAAKPDDAQEVHNALAELKSAVDTKNADTEKKALDAVLKIEEKMSAQAAQHEVEKNEKANQIADLTEKLEAEGKSKTEISDRLAELEVTIANRGHENGGADERKSAQYTAFMEDFMQKGVEDTMDLKIYRTDSAVDGGYLLPKVMDNELRRLIVENSPARRHCRVKTTNSKVVEIIVRNRLLRATRSGEAQLDVEDTSEYGTEQLTMHALDVTVPMTRDQLLGGSAFDIEREMNQDVSEAFAVREGLDFVRGNGVNEPEGFMIDDRVQTRSSAAAGVIDYTDLALLTGDLKRGQDPMFVFNRRMKAKLLATTDGEGRPIWTPGSADGTPPMIWGYRYDADFIDMDNPDVAGNEPIIFGDFRRGYEIHDRTQTEVIRDDYTRKRNRIIEYTFYRYNDGKLILPDAFVKLAVS